MRSATAGTIAALACLALSTLSILSTRSCSSSPSMPAAPTTPPTTAAPPPPPSSSLAGAWSGSANDSQGQTTVTWTLTQSGDSLTGTVVTNAVNPEDGSCNSCHRNKSGTVTGTVSGSSLTMTMFFAAGADGDPTPACSATMTGSMASQSSTHIAGTYTGSDTCEGAFLNGALQM